MNFLSQKKHRAASEHTLTLDRLFIDVQLEWESIFSGQFSDEQIQSKLYQLRKLRLESLHRDFPDGLAEQEALRSQAQREAEKYFRDIYGV